MQRVIKISGKKVSLGLPMKEDIGTYYEHMNDRETLFLLGSQFTRNTYETQEAYFEWVLKGKTEHSLVIIENESGDCIGNVSMKWTPEIQGTHELGMLIFRKDLWNKGYGSEALKMFLSYAFVDLGIRKLFLEVIQENKAAYNLYQKMGFQEIWTRRADTWFMGAYRDKIIMELFSQDFFEKFPDIKSAW